MESVKTSTKRFLKRIFGDSSYGRVKNHWNNFSQLIALKSIKQSSCEQKLSDIICKLEEIVPDIEHQYSTFKLDSRYILDKVRAQHAFQIFLVQEAIKLLDRNSQEAVTVVDIGDSAGTHIQYIKGLFTDQKVKTISVNLDEKAVEKIKRKGLEAICIRAEELGEKCAVNADIFLSFETLEHLINPVSFLRSLSAKTNCKLFVITVPYLKSSRVGLHHIRNLDKTITTAENTHLFELSPKDWRLLFQFTGWRVMFEKIYFQYPKKHWLRITKPYWKLFDFEGFYGVILAKSNTWCDLYNSW